MGGIFRVLKIEPVSREEIYTREFGKFASTESIARGYSKKSLNKYIISRADAHVRSYIELKLPCINSVTCGTRYINGARLLGLTSGELYDIANFKTAYSIADQLPVSIDDLGSRDQPDDYLFNGQYVLKLIDDMDIEAVIRDTLFDVIKKELPPTLGGIPKIERGSGIFPIYGDYYLTMGSVDDNAKINQNHLNQAVLSAMQKGSLQRISMLINIVNGCNGDIEAAKEYMRGVLVFTIVPIPPLLMRPSAGKKKHTQTSAYSKLLEHNRNYSIFKDIDIDSYVSYYRTMYSYLDIIVRANPSEYKMTTVKTFGKLRSVMSTMKGKPGFMRSQMSAKRQDYSGRAAVAIDPFMPLNHLGLPKSVVPKNYRLWAYREDKLKNEDILNRMSDSSYDSQIVKSLERSGVIEAVPIVMGRNPTLHKHGVQGFHVNLVNDRAVHMSPLVCPAYNMDFDGDTGHHETPVSWKSVKELENLIMTDKNLRLPKTGESTICPRMDMLYGLYTCSTAEPVVGPTKEYQTFDELLEDICSLVTKLGESVSLPGYGIGTAGKIVFLACFPKTVLNELPEYGVITSKTIKQYINVMLQYEGPVFNDTINKLVKLGFKVAYMYSESVSMLADNEIATPESAAFDDAYNVFHENMRVVDELNSYGFYDSETYSIEYSKYLKKVDDAQEAGIFDRVGHNMFVDMAKSGARGNKSNLIQIFGSKGRIQKSERESFDVTIEHSLRDQLNPMEHAIAAHGARRGQIAKSLRTADTGYFARQLADESITLVVTSEDCGTKDGIVVSLDDLYKYYEKDNMSESDEEDAKAETVKTFKRFVIGRYTVNDEYITEKNVDRYVANGKAKIRSPLTCKDPLCVKCYGRDPGTGKVVKVGAAVGIVAAQSLSEPATQLTMKVFQKGGVQGSSSSVFDRLEAVLSQTDIRTKAQEGRFPTYDPLAWAPGTLKALPYRGNRVMLKIVPDNEEDVDKYDYSIERIIADGVSVKSGRHVEYGETLKTERGDVYTKEVLERFSADRAAYEMLNDVYFMFKEHDLVPIHIEVVILGMMSYQPVITDVKELKLGMKYTRKQLCVIGGDYRRTVFNISFRGVKNAAITNANFVEALFSENQHAVLSRAILNKCVDYVDNPLVQTCLGMLPRIGEVINPRFMEG